jgi:hypothetical protein
LRGLAELAEQYYRPSWHFTYLASMILSISPGVVVMKTAG